MSVRRRMHPLLCWCLLAGFFTAVVGRLEAQDARSAFDSLLIAYYEQTNADTKLSLLIKLIEDGEDIGGVNSQPWEGWFKDGDLLVQQVLRSRSAVRWWLLKADHASGAGEFEAAYTISLKAIEIAAALHDGDLLADANYAAAFSLSEFDADASVTFYLACIDHSRSRRDSVQLADCLIDYSDALSLATDYHDSLHFAVLTEARVISERLQLGEQRLTNYGHHVDYYLENDELELAKAYLPRIKNVADSLAVHDSPHYEAYGYDVTAVLLQADGRYREALAPAREALRIMLENDRMVNLKYYYESLIGLLERTGDYAEAFALQKEYMEHLEASFSADKQLLVSRLNERYRVAEKERLIDEQQSALGQVYQRYLLLGGLVVLFGCLLILVYFQSQRIKRNNVTLSVLSAEASVQNDRLNTLLGELHHRVKNNLQLVSSLLRLQARKTSDDSIKTALSTGQRRVEAMSIIHQRLYQQDDITVVDLQSVIEELVQRTDFAYRSEKTPLRTVVRMDPKQLDATQAIPLTLIINELTTNSCKYAFEQPNAQPMIQISLKRQDPHQLILKYSDNGPGFTREPTEASGFGMQLIGSLSGQLGGTGNYHSDAQGAHFELVFASAA